MQIRFPMLAALVLLVPIVPSCGPVSAFPPQEVPGAPQGWDDLKGRAMDFEVSPIEPGVGLLIDSRTGRAWILVGNPHSWQAITDIGGL